MLLDDKRTAINKNIFKKGQKFAMDHEKKKERKNSAQQNCHFIGCISNNTVALCSQPIQPVNIGKAQ